MVINVQLVRNSFVHLLPAATTAAAQQQTVENIQARIKELTTEMKSSKSEFILAEIQDLEDIRDQIEQGQEFGQIKMILAKDTSRGGGSGSYEP